MSFEVTVKKLVPKEIKVQISNEQEKFCNLYTRDHELMGDPVACYLECYEIEPHEIGKPHLIKQKVNELLNKPQIVQRINSLIEEDGFNDLNVDKQHLFLINQHKDLTVKMKGIEHYNKLKKRTSDQPVFVLPRPLMELDEEPIIHQVDKEDVNVVH